MRIERAELEVRGAAALNPTIPCRVLTRLSEGTRVVPAYVTLLVSAGWVGLFTGTIFAAAASA